MDILEMKALITEDERQKRTALNCVITRRKEALQIAINNLVRDIDNMPPTAQDVIAVYMEMVSKLYTELVNIN